MSGVDGAPLATIVDGLGDAIVTATPAGVITGWNRSAEQLYGYSAEEALGRSIEMLCRSGEPDYVQHASVAASGLTTRFEAGCVRRDGTRIEIEVTFAPARDSAGEVSGVWLAARDVSERKRAERELARLSQAVELTDAVISLDLDAHVRHWSAGAERLFGFSAEEVIGLGIDQLNALSGEPEDAAARWRQLMPEVLVAHSPYVHELQRRHKDGTVIDLLGKIVPWRADGRVVGVTGLLIDITARKRAEREFVRLAEAAEYGTDAVVSIDLDGCVRHWNRGAEGLYGVSAQDAIGKHILEVNALTGEPAETNARTRDVIARALRGEPAYRMEARRRRRDGVVVDVLAMVTSWHVDGRLAGVTSTAIDITERKRIEEAAASLAAIVQSSDDAIIGQTLEGQITSWNAAAEQIYGYTAAEAVGCHASMLATPGREDELTRMLATVSAGESVIALETVHRHRDGRPIEVSMTTTPIRDRAGRVVSAASVACDITERKAAERELARLAQAAEHGADAIVSFDRQMRVCHWNSGAERISGYRAEEVIGLSIDELNDLTGEPQETRERGRAAFARLLDGGPPYQAEGQRRRRDGTVFDMQTTFTPWVSDGRVVGITNTTVDITERKQAERARELALTELEEAQRLARLGSWTWDPGTATVTWSAQMYELFDRDPAAGPAVGDALLPYVHPDDRDLVSERYGLGAASGPEFELDFRIVTGRGEEALLHAIAREDPSRPGCYVGTFQDVTDRRRAEMADAANRAKSQFLARMSHELRTPLNAISGFAQLLQMDDLDPAQTENVEFVLKGANHLLALINEVLDLSRIETGQIKVSPEAVALAEIIADAVALVTPQAATSEVTLEIDTSGLAHEVHVYADAQRLKQVLLNLLSNAIKYNRPGGSVGVSVETSDSRRVRALVSDTGIGIQPGHMAQLFKPFERLGAEQRAIEGTGLGLALSKGLVEAMGGTIEAASTLGVGSTFTIELAGVPAPHSELHQAGSSRKAGRLVGPGDDEPALPRILYIEDNISNVKLAERILERHATVELIAAMQGSIGLALAREHRPDMIILDLHLPDMHGEEVLQRLKAEPVTRDIPVVVLTADASRGLAERLARIGSCEFLSKPLDVPRFLNVIAAYIDSAGCPDP